MAVQCLTGARFTMNAEVLKWGGDVAPIPNPEDEEIEPSGEWVPWQDPISGEIYNKWVPGPGVPTGEIDNPNTDIDESTRPVTIPCVARGIVDGGIRVAGSTERFGDTYENIDFVKLWVPSNIQIAKSDRITNIRDKRGGKVMWKDLDNGNAPIVFNVNGVVPLFDAFNRQVESFVLLERVDATG